jgi:hypothetical protein
VIERVSSSLIFSLRLIFFNFFLLPKQLYSPYGFYTYY